MPEPDNNNIDKYTIHMVMLDRTVEQALQDRDTYLWREAITSKVESLNSYHVFHHVETVTDRIIPTKLVLVRKLNEKGRVEHYKARLVVQGFFSGQD